MSVNYYKVVYVYKNDTQNRIGTIIINCENGYNIISCIKEKLLHKYENIINYISICLIKCEGCIHDSYKQLHHMDKGGCLYIENFYEYIIGSICYNNI